jgi:nicotinamide-nucleotide amidase
MGATDVELQVLATDLGEALRARRWTVATAESCTGGWIAKVLTDVAGSSAWFGWGFVTYQNQAKVAALQVAEALINEHGAVSEPVVRAMAEGARARSGAELSVAVSGIAGPDGGSQPKPVGTVWFAWSGPAGTSAEVHQFDGNREAVRRASVLCAIRGMVAIAGPA